MSYFASDTPSRFAHNPSNSSYLSTKNDIAILKRATRLMTRLVKTEPLASMLHPAGDNDPILDHRFEELDDTAAEAEIRRKVETIYHPTSTARMAPKEDGGVVDPFLRVHGIPNLRIVDASIFPTITSGPTVRRTIAVVRSTPIECSLGNGNRSPRSLWWERRARTLLRQRSRRRDRGR